MSLQQLFDSQDLNVHNFCYGTVKSYYNYQSYVEGENCVLIVAKHGRTKKKLFIFNEEYHIDEQYDIIYSSFNVKDSTARKEICHNLSDIFNPECYPNSKKRQKILTYPFNWAERNGLEIRQLVPQDLEAIEKLHSQWVEKKLADEKTFQIMFPKKRYITCIIDGFYTPNYLLYGAYYQDQLIGCRSLYVYNQHSFDLAFFVNSPISQITNYVDIIIMKDLLKKGILYLNRGIELNKGLKNYKMHYPHFFSCFHELKAEKENNTISIW